MLKEAAFLATKYESLFLETEAMLKSINKTWDDIEAIQAGEIRIPKYKFIDLAKKSYKKEITSATNFIDNKHYYDAPIDLVIIFKDSSWMERVLHDEFIAWYWQYCVKPTILSEEQNNYDIATLYSNGWNITLQDIINEKGKETNDDE